MGKITRIGLLTGVSSLVIIAGMVIGIPSINRKVSWRADVAMTYLRGVLDSAGAIPTPLPQPQVQVTRQALPSATPEAALEPTKIVTPGPTPTPTSIPTPIPEAASLLAPKWEKQDANNCGPATLALYLRHYGWDGDQFTISEMIKPFREDRNVNVDELEYYVRNRAGWLNFEYRVGGDLETIKRLLAADLPVMIEEGSILDQSYWPNDDQWAAHYLLLTAYDDRAQTFTGQDTYYGANKQIPYSALDDAWQAFNRVYIMIYPPEREQVIKSILGENWDGEFNRQIALQVAKSETESDPQNPFTWFNLGSNLAYFERYIEASQAFDEARSLGLPQRMLRYQFTPFMAYFHSGQMDELDALLSYALKITRNSEEAFLWRGWMNYRKGDQNQATTDFRAALEHNPNYEDAKYALRFVGALR